MYYKDTNSNNNGIHIGILLLRIVIGGILLFHGISKLHDISFVKIQLVNHALPSIWAYGVYIGEIVDTGAWAIETLGLFLGGAICLCFLGGGKYVLSKKSKWD